MSDIRLGDIALRPSRTRQRLLRLAAAAAALLAVLLSSAATAAALAAAGACALCAAGAWFQGSRPGHPGVLRVDAAARLRAVSASRVRIVFFAAQRHVVVWHDATDPATFRRLAVLARWQSHA